MPVIVLPSSVTEQAADIDTNAGTIQTRTIPEENNSNYHYMHDMYLYPNFTKMDCEVVSAIAQQQRSFPTTLCVTYVRLTVKVPNNPEFSIGGSYYCGVQCYTFQALSTLSVHITTLSATTSR